VETEDVIDLGDRVLVLVHAFGRLEGSQGEVENTSASPYTRWRRRYLRLGARSALAEAPDRAQTAPLFGPIPGANEVCEGGVPTPKAFGFVVLNTPGNETTLSGEVALKNAKPKYRIPRQGCPDDLRPRGVGCTLKTVGTITTNKNRNGNLHFTDGRLPGTTSFNVAVVTLSFLEIFESAAVELD
jgi:hypothetical protein